MRDLSKSNGRAFPSSWKRSGRTASTIGHAGLAKLSPMPMDGRTSTDQQPVSGKRVSPSSDFEGFGSFSS
ncbi:hypothetical protein MPAR168_09950 [Methylorubrum populi]|uniref:Uncharacterized protein n=1 Tax=Methylobacterium radiotolerans TaxID=31998 RepID=A0ABU7TFS6_9HYPH